MDYKVGDVVTIETGEICKIEKIDNGQYHLSNGWVYLDKDYLRLLDLEVLRDCDIPPCTIILER